MDPGIVGIKTTVGTVAAVAIVGLPGRVGSLKKNIGSTVVIPDDKIDVAGTRFDQGIGKTPVAQRPIGMGRGLWLFRRFGKAVVGTPSTECGILANQPGKIDARRRVFGRPPRCRNRPVTAVIQVRFRVP